MNRKNFLWKTAWAAGSITTMPFWLSGKETKLTKADPLSAEKVKDFVIAGHNDLEKLKSLLQEFPTLIYATGIGAAEILRLLLKVPDIWATKKLQTIL